MFDATKEQNEVECECGELVTLQRIPTIELSYQWVRHCTKCNTGMWTNKISLQDVLKEREFKYETLSSM